MHVWFVHATAADHVPLALQVSTALPEHWTAPLPEHWTAQAETGTGTQLSVVVPFPS